MEFREQMNRRYYELVNLLISELNEDGFWTGRLSSSALATAVAVVALKIKGLSGHQDRIENGLNWLLNHVNEDGGFGDTPESLSNVSTSLLSYAAIRYCGNSSEKELTIITNLENYLFTQNISLNPDNITSSVLRFYGKDYTFSVPILSMLVICGVMDEKACGKIPQLPFEFVLLPSSWYSFFNLRVVSYALPALIAMGIYIYKKRRQHNPFISFIRKKSIQPSLRKLFHIMPESGGFLEATPLTGFVSMCLVSSGIDEHPVIEKGIGFLLDQQRPDGSWPIDTDLSTWVSTLAIKALGPDLTKFLPENKIQKNREHLLHHQYREKHSFNGALAGGWGWTNYPGSVPDVDDTCGAILSLLNTYKGSAEENLSLVRGCKWLLAQQNNDGGFPTFCRGWGKLPFDSSCSDLTGHAFCALLTTVERLGEKLPSGLKNDFLSSASRGLHYLIKEQRNDGSWIPLWFGNQLNPGMTNPVYGTSKVVIYLSECLQFSAIEKKTTDRLNTILKSARNFLVRQQNSDGSWGGAHNIKGTVEETSLAVSALGKEYEGPCFNGIRWLDAKIESQGLTPSPIGLYFASLWYDEKLYPLIYYTEALQRYLSNN
jgi:squalene-hopene/tetraprenyl-beta-curcumene cyclase